MSDAASGHETPPRSAAAEPFAAVASRAALWLVFLAPFFYLSYGLANWLAAQRSDVPSVVYGWEHHVPFLPWSILPYWSINAFYALSLFVNPTRASVDRLAGRYLTAQLVAVACFVAFPLTATFERPPTDGLPGTLFAILGGFDKPFNQAPSLHIALLVIIWDHLRGRLARAWRLAWHVWCLLIGASVLTTWQHHALDIPTGALLGLFALWLFPADGPLPVTASAGLTHDARRRRLAARYASAALALLAAAVAGTFSSAAALALLWPALAMAIVAWAYAVAGADAFQKRTDGSVSLASRLLLLPYRLGVALNILYWTRGLPAAVEVASGLHLGRFPTAAAADGFATVVDLAAETVRPAAASTRWHAVPMLDLVDPEPQQRRAAVDAVDEAFRRGPVLVCCALGFQRSAGLVAAWLAASGRAAGEAAATERLRSLGRPVHLRPAPPDGAG